MFIAVRSLGEKFYRSLFSPFPPHNSPHTWPICFRPALSTTHQVAPKVPFYPVLAKDGKRRKWWTAQKYRRKEDQKYAPVQQQSCPRPYNGRNHRQGLSSTHFRLCIWVFRSTRGIANTERSSQSRNFIRGGKHLLQGQLGNKRQRACHIIWYNLQNIEITRIFTTCNKDCGDTRYGHDAWDGTIYSNTAAWYRGRVNTYDGSWSYLPASRT